jgi:predicted TIM-barrel fold metal-dependent hydrolase
LLIYRSVAFLDATGTDWPLCYLHMTYEQALEVVRSYADFIPEDEMSKILGGNFQRLVGDP